MDASIPGIRFDDKGVCNYCRIYDEFSKLHPLNEETKQKLVDQKELADTRVKLSEKSLEKLKNQFEELENEIKTALEAKGSN